MRIGMEVFNQLATLEDIAKACAHENSGEPSVAQKLRLESELAGSWFSKELLAVVDFCAEECRRQQSGELSVFWMVHAYMGALKMSETQSSFDMADVLWMAATIEPEKNDHGFRKVPVSFRNGNVIGWENIERQMCMLIDAQQELSVEDLSASAFYEELEKIHPLKDGNGRLGKILFNWRNGTLWAPVFPPEPNWQ